MGQWNEQAAPNNNLPPKTIKSSEMLLGKKANHEFSEELSEEVNGTNSFTTKQRIQKGVTHNLSLLFVFILQMETYSVEFLCT